MRWLPIAILGAILMVLDAGAAAAQPWCSFRLGRWRAPESRGSWTSRSASPNPAALWALGERWGTSDERYHEIFGDAPRRSHGRRRRGRRPARAAVPAPSGGEAAPAAGGVEAAPTPTGGDAAVAPPVAPAEGHK